MVFEDDRGSGSSDLPWVAELDLSEAAAANLITSQFPELMPAEVRTISEGPDRKTFDVGGRWVFRFPKRRDVAAALEGEVEILPHLAARLPVSVPTVTHLGRGSARFPFSFLGYPRLPGVDLRVVRRRSVDVRELGDDLARMLSALHAFPARDARACGVGTYSPGGDLVLLKARAKRLYGTAHKDLPDDLAERLQRFLADPAAPAPYAGPLVLAHNDLGPDHVLVDAKTARLSGVVDWGDVGLGDPAVDLAGLWSWLGAPLLEGVAAGYALPLDGGALERARYIGACLGVFRLAHGLATENRELVAAAIHTLSFARAERVF